MKPPRIANSLRPPSRGVVLATVVFATAASLANLASLPASLEVNGQAVAVDVPPVTSANHVYVPVRAVADRLGADTLYDARSGSLEITRGNDTLRLRLNDKHATFNGSPMTLRTAPFIVRGRTMVGIHVISRAFGSKVSYDQEKRRIYVSSEGLLEAGAQTAP